ncbi:MAG: hypothetical protein Q8S75_09680, partial [Nitrospirota bacterium]|nr:hypothetical protein [Nitrospirota bacterium]
SSGRPNNPLPFAPLSGDRTCMRCGGLLVTEYYLDLQDDTGQIGVTGLRCTSCGEVVDPVILRNRLNQTPDLLYGTKQRKYALRVDRGMSDGPHRSGHKNDRQLGDYRIVGTA